MDEAQQQLLGWAKQAAENAHAPYSNFRVGAAVLADGQVFTGCNVENASYGLSLCAERNALSSMVAAGHTRAEGVAVYCLDADPNAFPEDPARAQAFSSPCGACRQWLAELAPEAWVVTNAGGPYSLADLLPMAFRLGED